MYWRWCICAGQTRGTHQMAGLFYVKWPHSRLLKCWRHIRKHGVRFTSAILIRNPNPIPNPSRSEPNNFSFNSLLSLFQVADLNLLSYQKSDFINRCVIAYFLDEQSCQISSWSDLKRRSLRLFRRLHPNKKKKNEKNNNKKMSIDMIKKFNSPLSWMQASPVCRCADRNSTVE